jgi:hypothetical protein
MSAAIAQRITLGLGVVYVAVGLRGFIPGITVAGAQHPGHGLLLGIFAVNALHNVVHLAAGALLIWASTTASNTILVNRALAVVFALLVVASLIAPVVEGVAINPPDTLLHLATALLTGYLGYLGDRRASARA